MLSYPENDPAKSVGQVRGLGPWWINNRMYINANKSMPHQKHNSIQVCRCFDAYFIFIPKIHVFTYVTLFVCMCRLKITPTFLLKQSFLGFDYLYVHLLPDSWLFSLYPKPQKSLLCTNRSKRILSASSPWCVPCIVFFNTNIHLISTCQLANSNNKLTASETYFSQSTFYKSSCWK